jgi:hypothetical protein
VARQQGVDELRDDGVVVADDAREQRAPGAQLANEVLAHFFVNRTVRHGTARHRATKLPQSGRSRHVVILSMLAAQ